MTDSWNDFDDAMAEMIRREANAPGWLVARGYPATAAALEAARPASAAVTIKRALALLAAMAPFGTLHDRLPADITGDDYLVLDMLRDISTKGHLTPALGAQLSHEPVQPGVQQ